MRNALKRMLKSGYYTARAIAAEVTRFPPSRQSEAVAVLTAFAGGWPSLGAEVIAGQRLTVELSQFAITCLPHATVRLNQQRLALRFSYGQIAVVPPDEKKHLELLRLALTPSGVVPAVLRVRGSSIYVPLAMLRSWRRFGLKPVFC
jgi:hypothetical protein